MSRPSHAHAHTHTRAPCIGLPSLSPSRKFTSYCKAQSELEEGPVVVTARSEGGWDKKIAGRFFTTI